MGYLQLDFRSVHLAHLWDTQLINLLCAKMNIIVVKVFKNFQKIVNVQISSSLICITRFIQYVVDFCFHIKIFEHYFIFTTINFVITFDHSNNRLGLKTSC
eukprot:NODE_110_length_18645_cov_0.794403.p18 type:complete len:101 gc:universal NODE_110_length_18645_cov_0.794403:2379-2077(-)